MANKLGLPKYDRDLAMGLLQNMYEDDADFTNTFRALSSVSTDDSAETIPALLKKVDMFRPDLTSVVCFITPSQVHLNPVHMFLM